MRVRIAIAVGFALTLAVAGCSGTHHAGELAELDPTGHVNVLSSHVSSGSETLGPFVAGGKVDFEGTCVGKGFVWVTVTGVVGAKFGLGCTARHRGNNDPEINTSGGYVVVIPAHSTFSIRVKAPKATRWAIAVAASQH
jgi:hypothetical protein